MNYRKVKIKELNQVAELFDAYRVFYRKESNIDSAKKFLSDRIINNDSEIFIAENSDSKLVGFIQLYPLFSSTRMQKLWLLNDLYVKPDFRGKGISMNLIEKGKKLVQESNSSGMFLETEKSNHIGNSLYLKTGFELNEGSNYYEWNNS